MRVSIPITTALMLCALTLLPTRLFSTSACNSHRNMEKPGSATPIMRRLFLMLLQRACLAAPWFSGLSPGTRGSL